jgi:hypothetical protein
MLEAMRRGGVDSAPYTVENFTTVLGAAAAAGSDWVDVLKVDIEGARTTRFVHKPGAHSGTALNSDMWQT